MLPERNSMNLIRRTTYSYVFFFGVFSCSTVFGQDSPENPLNETNVAKGVPSEEDYQKLEKLLSGSTFEGLFTIDGKDGLPKKERYELRTVKKLIGDFWADSDSNYLRRS